MNMRKKECCSGIEKHTEHCSWQLCFNERESLRAEVERLKQTVEQAHNRARTYEAHLKTANEAHQYSCNVYVKEVEKLDAEIASLKLLVKSYRAKCARLEAALGYYADERNWYGTQGDSKDPRRGQRMVIASIDTDGMNWLGGHLARKVLVAEALGEGK